MRSSFLAIHIILVPALILALSPALPAQTCASGTRGALVFDGVDDYVRIPANPVLDGMTNFTFEAWFRATSSGTGFRSLFEKGAGNPYLIAAFPQVGAFLNGSAAIQGGPAAFDNIWHHFALTGSGNTLKIYFDGQQVAQATYTSPMHVSASTDLYLGASYGGGGSFFDHWSGAIDDVRIWNVTRTAAQIEDNRLYVLAGNEPGLVGYWRFDASGQTVVNSATATGSALDGTLGSDTSASPTDPTFTTTDFPPMFYCVSGAGQPNSNQARLQVNGAGVGTGQGPFPVSVTGGNPLTFSWSGPSNAPFALAFGHLNTNNFNFGCVGAVDIGTPPTYFDIDFLMNGLTYPGSLFYVLSNAGAGTQTFSVPQAAAGASVTVQGLVLQPVGSGCPLVLTAAFQIAVL